VNLPETLPQKYKFISLKMIPLWPGLNPSLIGSLMNNGTTAASNEEQEIR
jgi:hypothetical protein